MVLDQARQNTWPYLDPTVRHSEGISDRIFQKLIYFFKKLAIQQKSMKNYPVGKELTFQLEESETRLITHLKF